MITVCILFVFASGYGVATNHCEASQSWQPPSEVVYVIGNTLSLPSDVRLVTPSPQYIYRWSVQPNDIPRRYVNKSYSNHNRVSWLPITKRTVPVMSHRRGNTKRLRKTRIKSRGKHKIIRRNNSHNTYRKQKRRVKKRIKSRGTRHRKYTRNQKRITRQ